jgi:1-deoxy-D-xylulose-5-phosphate reductoisomerase
VAVKSVSVLGSTGSVGTQTVELLLANRDLYQVRALVAGKNAKLLAEQARVLRAEIAVLADPAGYDELTALLAGSGVETACGQAAIIEAAARPADWTMCAIMGAIGLHATLAAVQRGGAIALANKEALVCAGDVMLRAVKAASATLLPVDSEHNAIFQAMADGNHGAVERIILTASGGPFRTASLDEMRVAKPETALKHPVWSMGAKISIDSATMMNKGLELIEASRLFGMPSDRIDVLVHPQSTVHGLVCYSDGSVLAQLGSPDMRVPIAHTLAWPTRIATKAPRLNLAALGKLEFSEPDLQRFPALRLAREALQAGGGVPTLMSAANEVAVEAFLQRRIGFLDIAAIAEQVVDTMGQCPADSLDAVIDLDQRARVVAAGFCESRAEAAA